MQMHGSRFSGRFNPRAHAGRDGRTQPSYLRRPSFNPRAHAGRDAAECGLGAHQHNVSIHAPTRGATRSVSGCRRRRTRFNPRAHAGRDGCRTSAPRTRSLFQSTRPRGARHRQHGHAGCADEVSIHAPTRGATKTRPDGDELVIVSIHAPTRGATTGGRPAARSLGVSIHAPTRGATRARGGRRSCRRCFNPRAHAGRDEQAGRPGKAHQCFNPRAHAGRDIRDRMWHPYSGWFQSTRPRGARPAAAAPWSQRPSFNPRAHAGRDRHLQPHPAHGRSFNPRAHAGRDKYAVTATAAAQAVSIHAPTRGATMSSQRHEDNTKNTGSQRTLGVLQFEHAKMAPRGIRTPREPSTFRGLRTCPCLAGH